MNSDHIFYRINNIKNASYFNHELHSDDFGYIYVDIINVLEYLYHDMCNGLNYLYDSLREVVVPIGGRGLIVKKNDENVWKHDMIKLGNKLKLDDKDTWITLLNRGAPLNKAVLVASAKGYVDIVRDLIKRGGNANDGVFPAIKFGKIEVLKLLIENGVRLKRPMYSHFGYKLKFEEFAYNNDYFVIACKGRYPDLDVVKYLIEQNLDLTYSNQCIKYAIKNSHVDLVECLIENCPGISRKINKYIKLAKQEYQNNNFACFKDPNNVEIIDYLVKMKKDPDFEIDVLFNKIKHKYIKLQQHYAELDNKLQAKHEKFSGDNPEINDKFTHCVKNNNTNNRKNRVKKLAKCENNLKSKLNKFT
ncbi:putative ankyrin repeat protein [Cotonvirus japonicus]|uniref:Ankyrin repeat protein n=1 Tax=Cotonvirus japonicus TaxID=2811091 RepID=A0ABM7NR73_9VIRU|nr:putative ankyrin repeat protein [Cotonvirus japonicus]BCS82668.1 putative ankyrin repeat protein [Cotonvirus japonicus]